MTYEIMNLYAIKMAAVFMISTSTLVMRTGFTPRWIAFLGFTFGSATPLQRTLYRLDYTGLPAVGATNQHLYSNG